jgi:hypothetical protein
MTMRVATAALAVLSAVLTADRAAAEPWPAPRLARLPDSAFAAVETGPDGRKFRHLPHHDETGAVDRAHLAAARGRLGAVRWLDPANEAVARRHLDDHWRGELAAH